MSIQEVITQYVETEELDTLYKDDKETFFTYVDLVIHNLNIDLLQMEAL